MSPGEVYLLIAATRYQLYRRSYGSGVVAEMIVAAADKLSLSDREVIARDIREALQQRDPGRVDVINRPDWVRALDALDAAGTM